MIYGLHKGSWPQVVKRFKLETTARNWAATVPGSELWEMPRQWQRPRLTTLKRMAVFDGWKIGFRPQPCDVLAHMIREKGTQI